MMAVFLSSSSSTTTTFPLISPCITSRKLNNPFPSSSRFYYCTTSSGGGGYFLEKRISQKTVGRNSNIVVVKCESKESADADADADADKAIIISTTTTTTTTARKLEIGSPIIVVEAPKMLKTAASIPCLRANSGLVNPGDVGRIVSRKPKDVWAVRLTVGTYLIDGKYFKPLDLPP